MKRLTALYSFLFTVFPMIFTQGQELIKKKKYKDRINQEFYVLKENKDIKQGEYLATYITALDQKYIIEYGQYEKNVKTGKWLSFYYLNPSNFLKSSGNYRDGKKDGYWRYYYVGSASDQKISTFFGSEKRTNVAEQKKGVKNFKIEIDSTGQQVMCVGKYSDDKKIGIWEYYSRTGYLLQKYDHSTNRITENNLREPDNDFILFLGGPERFNSLYHTVRNEIGMPSPITKSSEVTYEVGKRGEYKFVHAYGDEEFKNQVSQVLEAIPSDWICMDLNTSKKLYIIFKLTYEENSFTRYKSFIDIKVVQ